LAVVHGREVEGFVDSFKLKQRVALRRADAIVLRQAADRVRGIFDAAWA
jgi:hypothetical protein